MAGLRTDRVLFLDFDGVLNTLVGRRRSPQGWNRLEPKFVECINEIVERTECEVVVSSSWRNKVESLNPLDKEIVKIERMTTILRNNGANFDVSGVTPDFGADKGYAGRGTEIAAWLEREGFSGCIAIVDDRDDMVQLQSYLVQTNPIVGIQDKDVEKLCQLLLKEKPRGRK